MDVEVLAAAAIYLYSAFNYYVRVHQSRVTKKKWRKRRWWMVTIHRNRTRAKSTFVRQCSMMASESSFVNTKTDPNVDIEYCGVCDYGGHCLNLAQTIRKNTPNAYVLCKRGRHGSFEVSVNNKLIYSKLQTMALPDYDEVAQVVNDVSNGKEPCEIKGQQPINCAIS